MPAFFLTARTVFFEHNYWIRIMPACWASGKWIGMLLTGDHYHCEPRKQFEGWQGRAECIAKNGSFVANKHCSILLTVSESTFWNAFWPCQKLTGELEGSTQHPGSFSVLSCNGLHSAEKWKSYTVQIQYTEVRLFLHVNKPLSESVCKQQM